MNIGVFGGTFNPIHIAHLIVAEQVREWFQLSQVYFVPSAHPPHKEGPVLDGEHRLQMVKLAVDSNPRFFCSSLEVDRGGNSYTIDTLQEMKKLLGEEHTYYFILGTDAFREIRTWKDYPRLLRLCKFIVISRPGESIDHVMEELSPCLTHPGMNLMVKRVDEHEMSQGIDSHGADIFFVPVLQVDIASSRLRALIKRGRSVRYQVPDKVEQYIMKHRLYKE